MRKFFFLPNSCFVSRASRAAAAAAAPRERAAASFMLVLRSLLRVEAFDRDDDDDDLDFHALQREAAADHQAAPSTLRAMLLREAAHAATAEAVAPVKSATPCTPASSMEQPMSAACGSSLADANLSLLQLPSEVLFMMLGRMDASTLCSLPLVSREIGVLVAASHEELWRRLVLSRYEPVRWALPDGALALPLAAAASARAWHNLYVSLATPGPRNWRTLAAAKASAGIDGTCWIVIEEAVYDVSEFKHRHPGMAASLELFGGTDATDSFREIPHSPFALHYMRSLEVRNPADGELLRLPPEEPLAAARSATVAAQQARAGSWLEMAQGVRNTGGEWLKDVLRGLGGGRSSSS